jgi:hypothetical protein
VISDTYSVLNDATWKWCSVRALIQLPPSRHCTAVLLYSRTLLLDFTYCWQCSGCQWQPSAGAAGPVWNDDEK